MTIWVLFLLTVVGMTVITVTVKASLYLSGQRCAGVCALDNDQRSHPCRPIDPSRLVFMRIPKTGSSSVFAILKEFSERKWFAVRETCAHDLEPGTRGATRDALPRMKRRDVRAIRASRLRASPLPSGTKSGQHDALPLRCTRAEWDEATTQLNSLYVEPLSFTGGPGGRFRTKNMSRWPDSHIRRYVGQRRVKFYNALARRVVSGDPYVPWLAPLSNRTLFAGHFFHADWRLAGDAVTPPPVAAHLPPRVAEYFGLVTPSADWLTREVAQVSFLREPAARLRSMYEFDRTGARAIRWSEQLLLERGDLGFEACLLEPSCVEANELGRWCALQTEFFCGLGDECARPLQRAALARAKENLRTKFAAVGVLEDLDASLAVMGARLPTYFEGVAAGRVPWKKRTPSRNARAPVADPAALAVLDQLCAMDTELYEYAKEVLAEAKAACLA